MSVLQCGCGAADAVRPAGRRRAWRVMDMDTDDLSDPLVIVFSLIWGRRRPSPSFYATIIILEND